MEEHWLGSKETRTDWTMCKQDVANGNVNGIGMRATPRVDTPKPKEFNGKQDAKELDTYLQHIKHYLEALNKSNEIEKGNCIINTWNKFKQELEAILPRECGPWCSKGDGVKAYCFHP